MIYYRNQKTARIPIFIASPRDRQCSMCYHDSMALVLTMESYRNYPLIKKKTSCLCIETQSPPEIRMHQ
jgi:hypothetical protein